MYRTWCHPEYNRLECIQHIQQSCTGILYTLTVVFFIMYLALSDSKVGSEKKTKTRLFLNSRLENRLQTIRKWFQRGKGVRQCCILSPCLFNLYAEYIMRNAGLEEAQAGIKIAGRNINNLR